MAETRRPSYASGASTLPLLGETIPAVLRSTVARWPDRDALVVRSQDYRANYQQLWDQVEKAARALLALGTKKGDRVGIWSPNRYEWVIVQFATARIGAILVNINPAYKATELRHALAQSGVSVLLLAKAFRMTSYSEILERVRGELPELRRAIVIDDEWDELMKQGEAVPVEDVETIERTLQFDDPINIQYTSGTTGAPKGATLSHHNILNNAYFIGQTLRYTEEDRVCIPVPFYHCFGMVIGNLACVARGATMVAPGEAFDPGEVLETVEAERCTSLYGVPTMFIAMLAHDAIGTRDLSTLRTGVMAGSPCPVEVMKQVKSKMNMSQVTIAYGMTETSPVSTQTAVDDPLDKQVGSVGRVHPHVEIKIIDPESAAVVPRGERGEFCTRGYCVMLGYWNDQDASRGAIDPAGWMHTGDLATMDDEGYVNIVGRIKDMIIRGGENLYLREIEEYLYTHPSIEDAQVIGVPSKKYGEEVMAWLKLKEGESLTDEALTAFCKDNIASFKIPRYWKIVDAFPMTVTGKIQKFKMREAAIEELGLQDAAKVDTA
ncbi:MAG: AMP-binding protein [Polyangiaceae bacterium]